MFGLQRICFLWKTLVLGTAGCRTTRVAANVDADGASLHCRTQMRPHCLILFLAAARASRFLILRHGETNHNAAGIIQGSSDISRLTEKGHEQAHAAGIAIAAKSDLANIDRTFVSSLTRAQQTLDNVAAASKLPLTGFNR